MSKAINCTTFKFSYDWIIFLIIQFSIVILFSLESWVPLLSIIILYTIMIFSFSLVPAIYFIIISLFIGVELLDKPIGVRIVDVLIIISAIGYFLHKILIGDRSVIKTSIDKPVIVYLIAISLSLFGAKSFLIGSINFFLYLGFCI